MCVSACVDMGVGMSVPRPPLAPCGSEKSWRLMGEVIESGVEATLPLQGEVESQPKGGEELVRRGRAGTGEGR